MRAGIGRQFTIASFIVLFTFAIAHSINAYVAHQLLAPFTNVPSVNQSISAPPPVSSSATQLSEDILRSGLFSLPQAANTGTNSNPAKPPQPPLEVGKKIRLRGTALASASGSMAVIEEITTKRQILVRLQEEIPNVGELAEIRKEGVLIRLGDQEELLALSLADSDNPTLGTPVPASQPIVSPPRRVVDRREVVDATANISKILTQAHAIPYFSRPGVLEGFRLDFIQQGSLYDKIGLQYGDILQRINGVELRDPGMMWNLFQQIQNERLVKVDVIRQSQKINLAFELR